MQEKLNMYFQSKQIIGANAKQLKANGFPIYLIHDLQKRSEIAYNSTLRDTLINCKNLAGIKFVRSRVYSILNANRAHSDDIIQEITAQTIDTLRNAEICLTAGFGTKYIDSLDNTQLSTHANFVVEGNIKIEKTWGRHRFTEETTKTLLEQVGIQVNDNSKISSKLQRRLYLAYKKHPANNINEFRNDIVSIIENMKIGDRLGQVIPEKDKKLLELNATPLRDNRGNRYVGFGVYDNNEIGELFSKKDGETSKQKFYNQNKKYRSWAQRERAVNAGKDHKQYVKDQIFKTIHHEATTASMRHKLYTLCSNPLKVDVAGSLKSYQLEKKDCFFNKHEETCQQLIDIDKQITEISAQDMLDENCAQQITTCLNQLDVIKNNINSKSRLYSYGALLRQKIGAILHPDKVTNNSKLYYQELS